MLKKYLFSDAEKASVEREIEIQKVPFRDYVEVLKEQCIASWCIAPSGARDLLLLRGILRLAHKLQRCCIPQLA